MKFIKFIIEKYRAIEYIELPLSNNLIPLIGINESGKTSILKAILCFDRYKDKYGRKTGGHLAYQNNYKIDQDTCFIKAEVLIDTEQDVKFLLDKRKIKDDQDILSKEITKCFKKRIPIILSRNLETLKYQVENFPLSPEENEKLADLIFEISPYILYFDDFSDRVPNIVPFTKIQLTEDFEPKRSKQAEWQDLIQEIFRRSTGKTLKEYYAFDDNTRDNILRDVKDNLNEMIIEEWNELKARGNKSYADDHGNLELEIKHVPGKDEGVDFQFKVIDKSHKDKSRNFDISERSKGFQWFFNFIVKLKFNSKYQKDKTGALYLLDEPGSYLHSSAQEELLRELKRISETNAIIFCTHSHHLLNPHEININGIKIIEKEEKKEKGGKNIGTGEIKLIDFGKHPAKKSEGALTPLYNALRLNVNIPSFHLKNTIITEGITDYYFFHLLLQHKPKLFKNHASLTLIPGAGAGQLENLISLAISFSNNYLVLLDNDPEGVIQNKRYVGFFEKTHEENYYKYNQEIITCDKEKNITFELEDFFSKADGTELKKITQASNLKDALPVLYYMKDKAIQKKFILELDNETMENLKYTILKINSI